MLLLMQVVLMPLMLLLAFLQGAAAAAPSFVPANDPRIRIVGRTVANGEQDAHTIRFRPPRFSAASCSGCSLVAGPAF
jgi:hypothetical protein